MAFYVAKEAEAEDTVTPPDDWEGETYPPEGSGPPINPDVDNPGTIIYEPGDPPTNDDIPDEDDQAPDPGEYEAGKYYITVSIPDTLQATFEFASGRLAIFGQYEASGTAALPVGELELRGTLGAAYIGGKQITLVPERGGQFQDRAPRIAPEEIVAAEPNSSLTAAHARNFLDCIKSGKLPNADVEFGHRSTTMSLLANISLATRSRLEWDADRERITNNDAANAFIKPRFRKGWELKDIKV